MTDAELSSAFKFWTAFGVVGCVIVILGIIGEGFELIVKWWKKRKFRVGFGIRFDNLNRARLSAFIRRFRKWDLEIETFAIALVAVGLIIEVAASHVAYGISDLQNSALNQEAGAARKDAGNAVKIAALANESASKFDAARAEADKEAALIRAENLKLQLQLQPRIITQSNRADFIFLTEKIQKIPVKISFISGQNETANYAYQIRDMLNGARFNPETNAPEWGINPDTHITRRVIIGDTNWPSVILYVHSTNNSYFTRIYPHENTNGYSRPIVSGLIDKQFVGEAILEVMKQLNINAEEEPTSEFVGTNEFEFYIMDKAN